MAEPIEAAEQAGRRRAASAFALAPAGLLAQRYEALGTIPEAVPVRGPEVGLVMLRGRAGGGGAAFNLGEASVARASVRLASGEIGHAMILGRDGAKARMAAHLDALWQNPDWRDRVEREVVVPALAADSDALRERAEETAATRVDFFTLARGED
ncbi:phosphonate C-P lyase system protein PhnG [Aureimonas sp. AU4]|uniref:phosphonate C-P lyase system protein PhnG n=1 Tax=Aureimonas sp. AU4 TaxID=1638163 RepID=UPI000782F8B6|nr:phosphonate C-P lyase system protein PhnG [Aureimonas sp. AU4]